MQFAKQIDIACVSEAQSKKKKKETTEEFHKIQQFSQMVKMANTSVSGSKTDREGCK